MKIAAAIILVIAVVANAQEEGAGKPNKKTTIYVLSRRLKRHRSCHHSLSRSLQALQVQLSTPPTCLCRVRRPARRVLLHSHLPCLLHPLRKSAPFLVASLAFLPQVLNRAVDWYKENESLQNLKKCRTTPTTNRYSRGDSILSSRSLSSSFVRRRCHHHLFFFFFLLRV